MSPAWTYDTLLAALQAWPVNTNPAYVANLSRIIGLGELRAVRDLDLEIFELETTIATVVGGATLLKPTDLLVARMLRIVSGTTRFPPLKQRTLAFLEAAYPSTATADRGRPDMYAEYSDTLWHFGPPADAAYGVVVRYTARPIPLSPAQQTSWLGTFVPDVLFTACLMESEQYIKADDRYADWRTKYYQELMPAARNEIMRLLRTGEYTPYKPAAKDIAAK